MNFASFKTVKTANERASVAGVARGQSFKLKYRKFISKKDKKESIETLFEIAKAKFTELNLENYGLIEIKDPESGVSYLATVDNDNATMLKRTNKLAEGAPKGKKFKSTKLEDSLRSAGIIVDTDENLGKSQFLDLNKVAENIDLGTTENPVKAYAIYEIVKGEDLRSDEEKAEDDAKEEIPVAEGSDAVAEEVEPEAEVQDEVAEVSNASQSEEEQDF